MKLFVRELSVPLEFLLESLLESIMLLFPVSGFEHLVLRNTIGGSTWNYLLLSFQERTIRPDSGLPPHGYYVAYSVWYKARGNHVGHTPCSLV